MVVPIRLRSPTTPPGCTSRRSQLGPATCRRHGLGRPSVLGLLGRYDSPQPTVPVAVVSSGASQLHTGSPDTAATVKPPGDSAG